MTLPVPVTSAPAAIRTHTQEAHSCANQTRKITAEIELPKEDGHCNGVRESESDAFWCSQSLWHNIEADCHYSCAAPHNPAACQPRDLDEDSFAASYPPIHPDAGSVPPLGDESLGCVCATSASKLCESIACVSAVHSARWASSAFLLAFIPNDLWRLLLSFHCRGVCPHKSCALAAIRGFRQGFIFGMKIRFPHALAMTVLFGSGSITQRALSVFSLTGEHARVLALFVFAYKASQCVFRHFQQRNTAMATMASGALAGAAVFAPFGQSPLVTQVNMYVLSRLVFGLGRAIVKRGWVPADSHRWAFPLFAAVSWGFGMYLFAEHDYSLQHSVKDSMRFLYVNSNQWPRDAESVLEWMLREP